MHLVMYLDDKHTNSLFFPHTRTHHTIPYASYTHVHIYEGIEAALIIFCCCVGSLTRHIRQLTTDTVVASSVVASKGMVQHGVGLPSIDEKIGK